MNRERLTILRDHLASLPDEQVDMGTTTEQRSCGTVACIMGWAHILWPGQGAERSLGLRGHQGDSLFMPVSSDDARHWMDGSYTRLHAIAAIQSMLDSPDDDALPVWPEASA